MMKMETREGRGDRVAVYEGLQVHISIYIRTYTTATPDETYIYIQKCNVSCICTISYATVNRHRTAGL